MSWITTIRRRLNWKWLVLGLVLAALVLVSVRVVGGRSLGLRGLASSAKHLGAAVWDSGHITSYSQSRFTNVVFLHHSVGQNLIEQGKVRQKFTEAGFNFWDQGYNWEELKAPDGRATGYSYDVPDDNTDPDGLARIFSQPVYPLPLNTLSGLLQHEVIAVKSCFPASDIRDDVQLARHKQYYQNIRAVTDKYPNRVFIVLTPPPLNPAETNSPAAARARAFANWLKSDEYLQGHPNLFTFDLFDYLAESNATAADYNMLRQAYRDGSDSHPNRTANETIGPLFVDFVSQAARRYEAIHSASR